MKITETDILIATTEALKEANPWEQATKLRDILLESLAKPKRHKKVYGK